MAARLRASQPVGGGGIDNEGTLTLTASQLAGNHAVSTAGSDVFGGGLFNNQGQATVKSTTFECDQSLGGGSLDAIGGARAGPSTTTPAPP